MFWNDKKIKEWGLAGGITPFDPELVNLASIDVRLGNEIKIPESFNLYGFIEEAVEDILNNSPVNYKFAKKNIGNGFLIQPGQFILAHTLEYIKMPFNVTANLVLKSTSARCGLNHFNAGWIDPGFEGQLTLEIVNHFPMPLLLKPGQRICQITIGDCYPPDNLYGDKGHYQFQKGVTEAWNNK